MLCKERKIEYFLRKEAKILFLILFWATCSTICCMFYVNKIHIGGGGNLLIFKKL